MKKIIILASGHSLLDYSPESIKSSGAFIIAVNGSFNYVNNPNAFFTLDTSEINLNRIDECLKKNIAAHVALPYNHKNIDGIIRYNRISLGYKDLVNDGSPEYWFKRWGCVPGLNRNKLNINTGNSTYGALGLAYHMNPEKILILGLDGTDHGHFNDQIKTNDLSHLNILFGSSVKQLEERKIKVVNGSINSKINSFEKRGDGLKWINQ